MTATTVAAAGAPLDQPAPAARPGRRRRELHPRADRGRWRQPAHRDPWFEAAWFGIPWRLAAAWVADVEARSPEGGR